MGEWRCSSTHSYLRHQMVGSCTLCHFSRAEWNLQ